MELRVSETLSTITKSDSVFIEVQGRTFGLSVRIEQSAARWYRSRILIYEYLPVCTSSWFNCLQVWRDNFCNYLRHMLPYLALLTMDSYLEKNAHHVICWGKCLLYLVPIFERVEEFGRKTWILCVGYLGRQNAGISAYLTDSRPARNHTSYSASTWHAFWS